MTFLLVITAALLFVGRFTVPGHGLSWAGTYEAFAHIWVGAVGAVFVVWFFQIVITTDTGYTYMAALLSLSAFEAGMFIHGVGSGKFKVWKDVGP